MIQGPGTMGPTMSATPSEPVITYPPELPVSQRRDDIAAAVRDHQVVIVAGETGSGKTTQLPKICLELGRGRREDGSGGLIGHTQPRRIAARSVAERIADELASDGIGEGLGDVVTPHPALGSGVALLEDQPLVAAGIVDEPAGPDDGVRLAAHPQQALAASFPVHQVGVCPGGAGDVDRRHQRDR